MSYRQRWGFKNTYTFGKHLAEQLVASYHGRHFPVAIVRPSLVSAVAGQPYPGYAGNMAGWNVISFVGLSPLPPQTFHSVLISRNEDRVAFDAGATGWMMSFAMGFMSANSVPYHPHHVFDIVPGKDRILQYGRVSLDVGMHQI